MLKQKSASVFRDNLLSYIATCSYREPDISFLKRNFLNLKMPIPEKITQRDIDDALAYWMANGMIGKSEKMESGYDHIEPYSVYYMTKAGGDYWLKTKKPNFIYYHEISCGAKYSIDVVEMEIKTIDSRLAKLIFGMFCKLHKDNKTTNSFKVIESFDDYLLYWRKVKKLYQIKVISTFNNTEYLNNTILIPRLEIFYNKIYGN